MKLSEWCDEYLYLSPEDTAQHGKYSSTIAPWQPWLLDLVSDPDYVETGIMSSTQMIKTLALKSYIGMKIHLEPGSMIFATADLDLARAFSKDRFTTMVRDTPVLRDKIQIVRDRASSNTIFHKKFNGGVLTFVGSHSASALASRPVRDALIDEYDKWKASTQGQGDGRAQLVRRVANAIDKKIITVSSPIDETRIYRLFMESTQERWHVPCPECGQYQHLIWSQLIFKGLKDPMYECQHCKYRISEKKKLWMLENGKAVAENPGGPTRYGHINELYSTWRSWPELVKDFKNAVKEGRDALQVFWNLSMGVPFKTESDSPEWERVYDLRESYAVGSVPENVRFLTAFVDVQGDRLEIEVKGWTRTGESYSIEHRALPGESAWSEIDKYLIRTWRHPNGLELSLRGLGIDSSAYTQKVYTWCRKHPRDRVFATKGASSFSAPPLGLAKAVDVNDRGKIYRKGMRVWSVGVSALKIELYSRLRFRPEGEGDALVFPPGYCHFPEYPQDFFQQLTVENLTWEKKGGVKRAIWSKPAGRANEALDLSVGNRAVHLITGIDRLSEKEWDDLDEAFKPEAVAPVKRKPMPFQRSRGKINL